MEECMRKAPERRWKKAHDEAREMIESQGYDKNRGVFTQSFQSKSLDAALLLLPQVGFLEYTDERMIRTTDAIREDLAECLAHQGRAEDAQEVFDHTLSASNDLGLFSEEYNTKTGDLLGNFPQGLTHLAHISVAVTISEHQTVAVYG